MDMTLAELAEKIGATLVEAGEATGQSRVTGCARLEDAGPGEVSFLTNPRYADQLTVTRATAVIVGPGTPSDAAGRALLVSDDPYFAFRNAMVALHPPRASTDPGVHATAEIDPSAQLGEGASVGAFAVIGREVTIGRRCAIGPHVCIGDGVTIGDDCTLHPHVVIYHDCVLGQRVTIHAGSIIGQDGFGYATHNAAHHKIPQIGKVVIEDDVELGAGCSIDRATLGSTIIGAGTKMSNAVTIGHGCHIGRANLFVGQVGLAGSVNTGDYVAMGGQVGVAGHLTIGDRVQVAAASGVMTDIPPDTQVGGTPAVPLTEAKRLHLLSLRLPELVARIKAMEREIEQLREDE